MLDVINKGPIVSMHRPSNDNASFSVIKHKHVYGYKKEEQSVLNLDVKVRISIRNSLLYHVYRLVQSYTIAQEIMNTLSSTFDREGFSDDEIRNGKCLMAQIDESHTEVSRDTINTFYVDLSQAAKDSKSLDIDSA